MTDVKARTKSAQGRVKPGKKSGDGAGGSVDGARLREDRLARGWSVRHLAAESGLAISTISKIENNKMMPTVDLYSRLLTSLGSTPAGWFYDTTKPEEGEQFVRVLRLDDQESVQHPTVSHKILFGKRKSDITVLRQIFPAHVNDADRKLIGHVGHELVYVIKGKLKISMQDRESITLKAEDTIHFSSIIPHFYEALGGKDCEVILVWRRRG